MNILLLLQCQLWLPPPYSKGTFRLDGILRLQSRGSR